MANYQDLINRGGTIYNQATGQGYSDPSQLATDLGIAPHQIDWSQITAAGGQGGSTTTNPITGFNTAIMAKLKSYQGLSSADLIKRQSAILKKMYQKQGQITPEENRVLSPQQQSAIRGGQVSALQPELEATKGQILDRKEAQKRFLETVGVAQGFSKQLEDVRGQQKDTALQALEIRAQAGDTLTQSEINNITELTGWSSQDVQSYFDVASQAAQTDRTLQELKIANERKDLAAPAPLQGTAGERLAPAISGAEDELRNNLQAGTNYKYVDINKYREIRANYAKQGLSPENFDSNFASYLSPEDRIQFGIGSTTNIKALNDSSSTSNDSLSEGY